MAPLVVKLTGAILQHPRCQEWLDAISSLAGIVVVCGGGDLADGVRLRQVQQGFSDGVAHEKALKSMVDNAIELQQRCPDLALCDSLAELSLPLSQSKTVFWLPRDLLGGHPEVEESWAVTSDSLAIWCAGKIGARACLLVKATEPPQGGPSAADWSELGYLDQAFERYAASALVPWQAVGVASTASCKSILQRFSEQH